MEKNRLIRRIFGDIIKETRESLGISQCSVAQRAGVSRSTVSLIESGERLGTMEVVLTLANALESSGSKLVAELEKRLQKELLEEFDK